jgi:hypothetical protein
MIMEKASFLKSGLVAAIRALPADKAPDWGKMNLQQMTEHMSREGFGWASGKVAHTIQTPEEHLPKMQAFLMSEKPFRENTPNALMPEEPAAVEHPDMESALNALQGEIDYFFSVFELEPGKIVVNPFFGRLDYEMSVQLLYKHAQHHLKQFGAL